MRKYNLKTGAVVATKSGTQTYHSNDMTDNSKNNTLVVVHNQGSTDAVTQVQKYNLSVFDTNMNKLKTVTTSVGMNGIAYCAERGWYAAGSNWNFYVLNEDFSLVSAAGLSNGIDTGKTRQGMNCDEDYVYFVQSSSDTSSGNIMMIYSWYGKFLARVELSKNSQEAETMFYTGNTLYLHCYRGGGNGGAFYKLTTTIPKS